MDFASFREISFPRLVPGLRSDQPWVPLPVGVWVTEGGVEPRAVSACFATGCEPRAAVALFVASGRDADELERLVADPREIARSLQERASQDRDLDRKTRRTGSRRPRIASSVSIEPRQEDGLRGFVIRLSRLDGSRPAFGYVLAARQGDKLSMVIAITATEDGARRVVREVAPHL